MDIKKNIRNELFNRQETNFLVESNKNPNFDEIKKNISENLSKPEDCINVYSIKGKFGRNTFLVKSYVYDSPKDLQKSIQKSRKQRREEAKAAEEAKKAEADAKKTEEEKKKAEIEAKKAEAEAKKVVDEEKKPEAQN